MDSADVRRSHGRVVRFPAIVPSCSVSSAAYPSEPHSTRRRLARLRPRFGACKHDSLCCLRPRSDAEGGPQSPHDVAPHHGFERHLHVERWAQRARVAARPWKVDFAQSAHRQQQQAHGAQDARDSVRSKHPRRLKQPDHHRRWCAVSRLLSHLQSSICTRYTLR